MNVGQTVATTYTKKFSWRKAQTIAFWLALLAFAASVLIGQSAVVATALIVLFISAIVSLIAAFERAKQESA